MRERVKGRSPRDDFDGIFLEELCYSEPQESSKSPGCCFFFVCFCFVFIFFRNNYKKLNLESGTVRVVCWRAGGADGF